MLMLDFDFSSLAALQAGFPVIGLAIVVGLTQVIKKMFPGSERFIPVVAMTIGVILSVAVFALTVPAVVGGIILGLLSVGAYEVGKTTLAGK